MSAAKHTPGLRQKFPCGCEARAGMESISLTRCPAHEAAPELREALVVMIDNVTEDNMPDFAVTTARAAIAKATGGAS